MFIDEARQMLESRSQALQELMGAWERVRLDFLLGKDRGTRMREARAARREADGNAQFFSQLEEAVLDPGLPQEVDNRLQSLFLELMPWQGQEQLRARQDELLTVLELQRMGQLALVGGRQSPLAELELLGEQLTLAEERLAVGQSLAAAGQQTAPLAAEWLLLEHEACQTMGYQDQVAAQAIYVGLDHDELEGWLSSLPLLQTPARQGDGTLRMGRILKDSQPIDLLRDSAELLGLDVEALLVRWQTRPASLGRDFMGAIEGSEGLWPVALWDSRPGVEALSAGLELLGRCLGSQAAAVAARMEGEETGSFPMRAVQARAFGLVLASLPGNPSWSARLLACADPEAFALSWRAREQALAARDLLRLRWLGKAISLPMEEWDALWSSLLLQHAPSTTGLPWEPGLNWSQDAALCLRPRTVVERVAARCLAASHLRDWKVPDWPEATTELGGRLLDELTDPPAEDWGDALDLGRSRLDARAFNMRVEAHGLA
jgi:hypothetical protein